MKVSRTEKNTALVELNRDEVRAINNSLNEVCHALDKGNFSIRMGVEIEEVEILLREVNSLLKAMKDL